MAQWSEHLASFIPAATFLAGLTGSLHCVGMCGGLVTASCHSNKDVVRYQFGRLLGYLVLGLIVGSLAELLDLKTQHPLLSFLPTLLIGLLFIYWGIKAFKQNSQAKHQNKALNKLYFSLWHKLVANNKSFSRSFFVGLISILLPCGFLYGVLLGTLASQSMPIAILGMLSFWFGTLPAMVLAPSVIRKILRPFQSHRPRIYASILIIIGLGTISFRGYGQLKMKHHEIQTDNTEQQSHHSCH